jgi:peptidoglycan/LPS O-acetylase OafA/YrhL
MNKLVWIQALRFLAALMVVGAHLIPGFDTIGQHGVDVFFVISGFVMVYSSEELFSKPQAAKQFMWRRICRIVPLYWLMTAVVAASGNYSWQHIATSLFFIPSVWPDAPSPMLPVLTVGWTLNVEMFFYLLFAAWISMPRRIAVPGVCVTLLLVFMLGNYFPLSTAVAAYWTSPKLLEFALGALIANAYRDGLNLPSFLMRDFYFPRIANVLGGSSYALYLSHASVIWWIGSKSIPICVVEAVTASAIIYFVIDRPITLLLRGLQFWPQALPRASSIPALQPQAAE